MSGDLEDRIGGGVDNPGPRRFLFWSQFLDDLGPRGGFVADNLAPRLTLETCDDLLREPVRVRRKLFFEHYTHHLPVASQRRLGRRALLQETVRPLRGRDRRGAFYLDDVAEPQRAQVRKLQTADGAGGVGEGIRALVAEASGIRGAAGADAVQDNN